MKIKLLKNTIIAIGISLFVSTSLMAAESVKNEILNFNFENMSEADYSKMILPVLPSSGYNYNRYFTNNMETGKNSSNTLNIFTSESKANEEKWFEIKSTTTDYKKSPYELNWKISKGSYFNNREEAALQFTTNMFLKSRNNDIESLFTKKISEDKNIINIEPLFSKNEKDEVTKIKGYKFDYQIQRSATYRAVRTTTEIFAACSIGVANYYYTKHENMVDWQYKYSWADAKQKVKDGWYWDPNNFNTNTLYHLYAGSTYYQIARSNDYSIAESLAWTIGGSFFWEFFGEWREQVSLNDMIFTPMLGAVVGECLIQTTEYIERNLSPSIGRDILVLALNPTGWINKKMDSSNSGSMRVQLLFKGPIQTAIEESIEDSM